MSQILNAAAAVVGIDIGKNSFHIVGLDQRGAIVLRRSGAVCQYAAVPDRHEGLRRRPRRELFGHCTAQVAAVSPRCESRCSV